MKKILTRLVNEEVLEFWSSGSTTMYGLKGPANRPTPRAKIKRLPGGRASRTGNSPSPRSRDRDGRKYHTVCRQIPFRSMCSALPHRNAASHRGISVFSARMQRLSGEGKGPCPAYRPRRPASEWGGGKPLFPPPLSGGGGGGRGPPRPSASLSAPGQRFCTAGHRAERPPYARGGTSLVPG